VQASEKGLPELPARSEEQRRPQLAPVKDNAIYQLAPPCSVSPRLTSRSTSTSHAAIFERVSKIESGETATAMKGVIQNRRTPTAVAYLENVPAYNATMRTTCVATKLEAGTPKTPAADGARDGQLPHPADRDCRNDARDSGQSRQR